MSKSFQMESYMLKSSCVQNPEWRLGRGSAGRPSRSKGRMRCWPCWVPDRKQSLLSQHLTRPLLSAASHRQDEGLRRGQGRRWEERKSGSSGHRTQFPHSPEANQPTPVWTGGSIRSDYKHGGHMMTSSTEAQGRSPQ